MNYGWLLAVLVLCITFASFVYERHPEFPGKFEISGCTRVVVEMHTVWYKHPDGIAECNVEHSKLHKHCLCWFFLPLEDSTGRPSIATLDRLQATVRTLVESNFGPDLGLTISAEPELFSIASDIVGHYRGRISNAELYKLNLTSAEFHHTIISATY